MTYTFTAAMAATGLTRGSLRRIMVRHHVQPVRYTRPNAHGPLYDEAAITKLREYARRWKNKSMPAGGGETNAAPAKPGEPQSRAE